MFPFLLPSLAAGALMALYLIPPGFVLAQLTNVAGFRDRSLAEKGLWSLALSYPVSSVCAVLLGRWAGPGVANGVLLALAAVALGLLAREAAAGRLRAVADPGNFEDSEDFTRWTWRGAVCLAAVAGLALFATSAVLVHGRLLEPVCSNDWYIRLPLQWAAGAGNHTVPPLNPLFTLAGQSVPLRYYYFFYVFCGLPGRLVALSPRALLVAGDVWAGLAFFAVAWLAVKYLLEPSQTNAFDAPGARPKARRLAILFFGASLITGLDLLVNVPALFGFGQLYPSVYWWSKFGVSSWPGFLPFIPHHFMGMACGALGYLLLTLNGTRRSRAACALLAGLCFAALLGTSTFLAVAVFACCGVLGLMFLLRREWLAGGCVALALLSVAVLDAPYIRDTFFARSTVPTTRAATASPASSVSEAARHAGQGGKHLALMLLHADHAAHVVETSWRPPAATLHNLPKVALLFIPLTLAGLYAIHYGFFLFVIWYTARAQLRRGAAGTPQGRALWCFFLTTTVLGTLVSSAPMQDGLNDLGRLAILLSRLVLTLWAAPLMLSAWRRWRSGPALEPPLGSPLPRPTKWAIGTAAVFAVIGLGGTLFDVADERIYLPLVDSGKLTPMLPFVSTPGLGETYAELAAAWAAIDAETPKDAVVQTNPNGALQRPVLLYLNRRVAAGDVSCETSFGGDTDACVRQNVRPLLALYGQSADQAWLQVAPDESAAQFDSVCRTEQLHALIVDQEDPAWSQGGSWVWTERPLYAGRHVRVLRCPSR